MESFLKGWTIASLSFSILVLSILVFGLTTKDLTSRNNLAQQTQKIAPHKIAGTVKLFLNPEEINLIKSQKTTVGINITTMQDQVTAAELHIAFNPKNIGLEDIDSGEFLSSATLLQKQIDNNKGTATFILGTLSPKSGTGQLALISLRGKSAGKSTLSLRQDTKVAAVNKFENVLTETRSAKVNVN